MVTSWYYLLRKQGGGIHICYLGRVPKKNRLVYDAAPLVWVYIRSISMSLHCGPYPLCWEGLRRRIIKGPHNCPFIFVCRANQNLVEYIDNDGVELGYQKG